MAALEEDEIFDEENFQESGFLNFPPEVQAAIDQVFFRPIYLPILKRRQRAKGQLFLFVTWQSFL